MDWPTTAELKQRLDVTSDDWDDQLDRVVAASIAITKQRTGEWVEDYDSPDEALVLSALELAVEMAQNGDAVVTPSKSKALLYGHRKRFGIG